MNTKLLEKKRHLFTKARLNLSLITLGITNSCPHSWVLPLQFLGEVSRIRHILCHYFIVSNSFIDTCNSAITTAFDKWQKHLTASRFPKISTSCLLVTSKFLKKSKRARNLRLIIYLQGPTENRQGEWAPWLNIIIIIIIKSKSPDQE